MNTISPRPFTIGHFTITPSFQTHHSGNFSSSLSVSSFINNQSKILYFNFDEKFKTMDKALRYACYQGHVWLSNPIKFSQFHGDSL